MDYSSIESNIKDTHVAEDPEVYEPPDEADYQCNSDDDDSSEVSLPAELPPPPDGGWGWVIVLVSFLANMVVDGVAYSFSPFLDAFSEYFGEPKGKVAWISSLLAGMYLSVGPVVSSLTNKFGCRPVCIFGAVIGAVAYGSTFFAHSVSYLMVTQGVVAGFGFGLIYLPAVVCVGYYFESKRALATGIAVCGSGVGTMLFPPLVNLLIENFGWHGANLIIAGIILNACWMGALMRPLEVPRMKKKDLLQRIAEERKMAMEVGSFYGSHYINVCKSDGTIEKRLKPGKALNFDPGVHSHLSFSEYLTPVPTSAVALPTIQEASNGHNGHGSSASDDSPHGSHDEKDKLVSDREKSGQVTPTPGSLETNGGPAKGQEEALDGPFPFAEQKGPVTKRASAPNFERRPSKLEVMSYLKVIPATPNSSYTNLRTLGSQDLKVPVTRYSIADPENAALRARRSSKDRRSVMLPPLSRQDIFYSGSIRNLSEFRSQASMLSYRESTFNLQNTFASKAVMEAFQDEFQPEAEKEKVEKSCGLGDFFSPFMQMLDFSMLRNPVFVLLGVANMIGMLGFYTPFVYLPAAAIEKGIDKESATFLVSIIGITNTIGRVLSGLIADIPCVDALWVNNISIIFSGLCVFLTPFATSMTAFVSIAVFFGFFVSAYISLTSIILVELLGLESLTSAFGLLILFRGLASLVGPPLAGSIFDATQSYDVSFYSAGALLFLCAFLHCVIPCVKRFCYCVENPVRYHTNEEYLQAIPESELDECGGRASSPDGGDGAGIMFDIKPKKGSGGASIRERPERNSVSSTGSREKVWSHRKESLGAQV